MFSLLKDTLKERMAHAYFPFHYIPISLCNFEPWNAISTNGESQVLYYSMFPIIRSSGKWVLSVKAARLQSERLVQNSLLLFKTTNELVQKDWGIRVDDERRKSLCRQRSNIDWPFWSKWHLCIISISQTASEHVGELDCGKSIADRSLYEIFKKKKKGKEVHFKNWEKYQMKSKLYKLVLKGSEKNRNQPLFFPFPWFLHPRNIRSIYITNMETNQ